MDTNMAIKYEATGPHDWSVLVIIENGKAYETVSVGSGSDAVTYFHEPRALIASELRLVSLAGETTDPVCG